MIQELSWTYEPPHFLYLPIVGTIGTSDQNMTRVAVDHCQKLILLGIEYRIWSPIPRHGEMLEFGTTFTMAQQHCDTMITTLRINYSQPLPPLLQERLS